MRLYSETPSINVLQANCTVKNTYMQSHDGAFNFQSVLCDFVSTSPSFADAAIVSLFGAAFVLFFATYIMLVVNTRAKSLI